MTELQQISLMLFFGALFFGSLIGNGKRLLWMLALAVALSWTINLLREWWI